MTTTDDRAVDRAVAQRPVPTSGRVGQATAVEQSRAMAQVQAAVLVAQQCPRDTQAALASMRDSCRQKRLAERAFYRYNRGAGNVSGPTVHLARELARVWGNVDYGIAEMSRDDEVGQSEMLAFAWDLQTNARNSQVFIVPHKRDKKGGPERLVDMRDIYEVNTNNAARRLRQAIWAILPPWFVEEAVDLCMATLQDGGGEPLPKRIAFAIDMFAGRDVSVVRLEAKLSRKKADWTAHDVAQLGVIYKSIERGETTVDDEFEPERVTAAEITREKPAAKPATEAKPEAAS